MNFIKKHWGNILFFGLIIFMFTPPGMPLRALLIKGVSYITSRVETLEIEESEQVELKDFNWELMSGMGTQVNLSDYKDKVLVINEWATWCPPCIAELPSLASLYKKYDKQVVFMFVTPDKPEKVVDFLQKNKMDIPVYFIFGNTPTLLQSSTIPTTFIIGKNAKIVVKKTGAADWNSGQVHEILDKLLKQ